MRHAIDTYRKYAQKVKKSNKIKTFWGDAFKSIKEIEDSKYDKIFVDLNDDQYCIDLAKKKHERFKKDFEKRWCYHSSSW